MNLDRSEKQILRLLQAEGRLSNVELAHRVGLSESPCLRRMKRLEETRLISGYAAVLDQRKLGLDVTAFVRVIVDKRKESDTQKFLALVDAEEHIVECHAMSGSYDYLLKVVARNIDHFAELSMHGILKFPGVSNIESSFSLKEIKASRALPVD